MEGLDYNSSSAYGDDDEYLDDLGPVVVLEESSVPETGVIQIFVAIYSIICFLGLLGNGLVIVIGNFKTKKTVNTIWFLNLAVADFLFNIFLPVHIIYVAMQYHWVLGLTMCKISNFLLIHNMYTSVFLLTAISLDRCVSVLCPVWAQNHRSVRLAWAACLVIWVLAFFLSSPSLVFRDTTHWHGKTICFNNFSLSANESPSGQPHRDSVGHSRHMAVTVTRFICGFLVPLFVITVCYLIIVHKLRRNHLAKNKKPFKVIVAIIVTFFLCWCPYHTLYMLELFPTAVPVPASTFRFIHSLATTIAIANSCMNPILYVFMGQDFKKFKVAILSRLANALSDDTGQSSYPSHRSFTKMSSMNERASGNDKETSML